MLKTTLRIALVVACSSLFTTAATAQLAMTRSTFSGTYTPIAIPAATLSTATGDDVAQSAIPIGFTFNYLGNNYTSIGVNTNGVASFDATMSASGTNNNLFATNAPQNSLAPWWDNLLTDTVLYQLQGVSPNQTFTIQWTNTLSYFNTATQQLNFQVILYETTNVIEFRYGARIAGVTAQNESASIGIEGATGGPGDYLDAITGSAFTSNGMVNALTQWPATHFRFTPGAPAPLAGGTYTVGVAGNYPSLSEALADVNHRGIAGPVVLSLVDAAFDVTPANGDNFFPMLLGPVAGSSATNTIMVMPATGTATISNDGTLNGNCGNAAANNIISNTNEPIFALVGARYVTLQNINFTSSATAVVDRGLSVLNSSATLGAQFNTLQNISVTLNRGNANSIAISQQAITTPTAASGANSNNTYANLSVSNTYTGIYLNGNAAFPDLNCSVGSTSPLLFNTIGGSAANDIGNGNANAASYGIRANNQNSVRIFNNEVRNVSHAGPANCEGIVIDAGQGNCLVYNNKVHDIDYTGATATGNITGIRTNVSTTGAHTVKIYNNFVYGIASTYTGAATATRAVRGIAVQLAGGGNNGDTLFVDFNNVRIDNSSALTLSSACFEIGTATGPVLRLRNNVFANFTGAQTGLAQHTVLATANATLIGNAGSVANYNDWFVNDTLGNGFTGIGQTTTYISLAAWQTATTQDANSIAVDPFFSAVNNLHVGAAGLNNSGNSTGITWVTTDIDNQPRAVTPDRGADEFTPLLIDAGVTAWVAPVDTGCHTAAEQVTVTLKNFASVPLDFTVNPVTITVNVSGAITQTLTTTINTNVLNANVVLPSGNSITVPVGTVNMTTGGTYLFAAYSTQAGDGNAANDTVAALSIAYSAGTATASPINVCAGSSTTLTLSGYSAGGSIQWQSSTDGGNTWVTETGPGATTDTYAVIPTGNTWYQAVFCGTLLSTIDSVSYFTLTAPTVADDTVCGPGTVNLTASGSGTINWYAAASGGTPLASGTTYSTSVVATTTFYVSNISGSLSQGVGLFDNSAGGAMSQSVNNLIFDVQQSSTLNGVYVYPATAGNVVVELQDSLNNVVATATVAVTTADINQRTYIPLGFSLTPGNNWNLVRNAASVNLWRNNVGINYPYTLPGIVSITGSTAGNGFYYFFYDWQIGYGCESPRSPLTVVVLTPPAVSTAAVSSTICLGDSTTLSVSSTNAGYTYTWAPAQSLNTSTGAMVVASPVASTLYTVSAIDSASGCRSIDSLNIVVNSVPPSTVSAADTLICSGQADTLVVNYPSFSVGLLDNSAGGNMSASVNNLIFDVFQNCTLTGVYVYPAAAGNVVIDLADNTNAVLNTVTVAVTAADVNQRTFIPINFNLTPGTGLQLVRNAASVNLWRNNVGVNYPYTLPGYLTITTSTAGNGFYYYFYDWQVATSGYTYSWVSIPAGYTGTNDSAFVAPTTTTQYIVTITDTLSGCTTQAARTITIAAPVTVTLSAPVSICVGDSATLNAIVSNGDGVFTYTWTNAVSTVDSAVVSPTTTTTYTVVVVDGCGYADSSSVTVVVSSGPPTGTFTSAATGLLTFTFTDNTVGSTSYAWDFGDSNTSTAANPTHVYSAVGTYTVVLIVSNGCGSDTITDVLNVTGIETIQAPLQLQLAPNPATESFLLTISTPGVTSATISIVDLRGKVVSRQTTALSSNEQTIRMDVSALAKGLYLLNVSTTAGNSIVKLIVE